MLNGLDLVARIKAHLRKLLARLALGSFDRGLRVAANLGNFRRCAIRLRACAGFGCRARSFGIDAGTCLGLRTRPLGLRLLDCSVRSCLSALKFASGRHHHALRLGTRVGHCALRLGTRMAHLALCMCTRVRLCAFGLRTLRGSPCRSLRALGGVAFGCGGTLLSCALGCGVLACGLLRRGTLRLCPLGIRARCLRNRSGMGDRCSLGLRIEHAHDEASDAGDRSPGSVANAPDLRARVDRAIRSQSAHAA
jgi:hypothetical protein